jgi:ferric-dicitrate binding protein FerR (iron transport regulator)
MTENQDSHWEKIAGKLHGELNSEEEAEFNEMMNDDVHLREFEKVRKIAENLAKSGAIPVNGKVKSWEKIENGIRFYQSRWIKEAIKYAAIITVAFIAGNLLRPYVTTDKETRFSEITVPFGQMSQITLSDGTKIWLNSGTTLRYPEGFAANSRTVSIDGEAFFQVAKMAHNPFTVNTSEMKVEVLGTSFNLSAYKEDATTSLTLVEGKVDVQNNAGKTIAYLSPGQMATKNKNETTLEIQNVKTAFYIAWKEGEIFFEDERLDQIAVKIERWFNVDISFANEHLKSQKFTGTILKNKPVDQIMQALELLSPIRFNHQVNANGKDKITIYNKN